ncbi:MAG TPA: cation transporter [Candidatus Binatia bacterium]|nr:cation transporter [Candidatus Binatia bacterium]
MARTEGLVQKTGAGSGPRDALVRRGRSLEYFTIGYNCLEGVLSVIAGLAAGSVSLIGFGLDSFIEVTSATAIVWRLSRDHDSKHREAAERCSLRIVGVCFVALAAYIAFESASSLVRQQAPEQTIFGIAIAVVSLIVMPILARAKRKIAADIESSALHADARQTDFCTYLSAILLGGLCLNAVFGIWWADPVAALCMVPIIAREGIGALNGRQCCGCSH